MAIAVADLAKIWSADTVERLRKPLVWNQITTQRRTEPWVAGMNQVEIPKPKWGANTTPTPDEGIVIAERTRDQGWTAPAVLDEDVVQFNTTGRYDASNVIGYEDRIELPWDAVEETRTEQVEAMADYLDTQVVERIEGYPSSLLGTLGTAGSIFISPDGVATGTGAAGLVKDAMDLIVNRALRNNWFSTRTFKDPGPRWAILHPVLYSVFLEDLIEQKYSWDALTEGGLLRNAMPGGDDSDLMAFNYRGFRCMATPAANLASATAADRWRITAGLRAAVAANVRPPLVQVFTPQQNQTTAPGWLLRQRGFYGMVDVEENFLMQAEIEQD